MALGLSAHVMPDEPESDLARGIRHVTAGRRIVARQRERIRRLKALGHPTLGHEQTLLVFESALRIFGEHEKQLRAQ